MTPTLNESSADTASDARFRYQNGGFTGTKTAHRKVGRPTISTSPPKSRYFVAIGLLGVLGAAAFSIWNSFYRYQAYGVVDGELVEVAVPFDAPINSIDVQEGDEVSLGQQLFVVDDFETQRKLARIRDDLLTEEATLFAEVARWRWNFEIVGVEVEHTNSQYYELLSRFERESAEWRFQRFRLEKLQEISAESEGTTDEELELASLRETGERLEVEALKKSAEKLKERADRAREIVRPGQELIEPIIARINKLLNELGRLEQKLTECQITSPVNGLVLKKHHSPGEETLRGDTVLTVLKQGTLEIKLFLRQKTYGNLSVGDEVALNVLPFSKRLRCNIVRIGDEMVQPPGQIEKYYRSKEHLYELHLKPIANQGFATPYVGAVAKLERTIGS